MEEGPELVAQNKQKRKRSYKDPGTDEEADNSGREHFLRFRDKGNAKGSSKNRSHPRDGGGATGNLACLGTQLKFDEILVPEDVLAVPTIGRLIEGPRPDAKTSKMHLDGAVQKCMYEENVGAYLGHFWAALAAIRGSAIPSEQYSGDDADEEVEEPPSKRQRTQPEFVGSDQHGHEQRDSRSQPEDLTLEFVSAFLPHPYQPAFAEDVVSPGGAAARVLFTTQPRTCLASLKGHR
ncbi:hypothetical protein V8E54_012213 [Elaphomyces granulatus]